MTTADPSLSGRRRPASPRRGDHEEGEASISGEKSNRSADCAMADAVASELLRAAGGGVSEEGLSAALSDAVEGLMGRELDAASLRASLALESMASDWRGGADYHARSAEAARAVADSLARTSSSFASMGGATRLCGAELSASRVEGGGGSSSDSGHKRQRAEGCSAGTGQAESFSLFDMLDRQPKLTERVTADVILEVYGEGPGGRGPGAETGVNWDGVADLLDKVEDMEDIVTDPFAGDVWEKIRDLLRRGLSSASAMRYVDLHSKLGSVCEASHDPAEFAQQRCDLAANLAGALSGLTLTSPGGCGRVLPSEFSCAVVRAWHALTAGLIPALGRLADDDLAEFLGGTLSLLSPPPSPEPGGGPTAAPPRPAHLLASYDPRADWFAALCREVPPARIADTAAETGLVAGVIAACRSYGGGPGAGPADAGSADSSCGGSGDGVVLGSLEDVREATYLQSLSVLRSLVVATDGCPALFPYGTVGDNSTHDKNVPSPMEGGTKETSQPSAETIVALLSPFRNVLAAGVSGCGGRGVVIGEDLAQICGEAAESIMMGQARNWENFGVVFFDFVSAITYGILNGSSSIHHLRPATIEFLSVCCGLLNHAPWQEAATEQEGENGSPFVSADGTPGPFVLAVNLLIDSIHKVVVSAADVQNEVDKSYLSEAAKVLQPMLRSCSLMRFCHRENILSSIRTYHTIAKAGLNSEVMFSLLPYASSFEGLRVLEELGLVSDCMAYAASLLFTSSSGHNLEVSRKSQLVFQVAHMLSNPDGCRLFMESEAFRTMRSYVAGFANGLNPLGDDIEIIHALLVSIMGGVSLSHALESNFEEMKELLLDVMRYARGHSFLRPFAAFAHTNIDTQLLLLRDNELQFPEEQPKECRPAERGDLGGDFKAFELVADYACCIEEDFSNCVRSRYTLEPLDRNFPSSRDGHDDDDDDGIRSVAQTALHAHARGAVRTILAMVGSEKDMARVICREMRFLIEAIGGTENCFDLFGKALIRSDLCDEIECPTPGRSHRRAPFEKDAFVAPAIAHVKFLFESNNLPSPRGNEEEMADLLVIPTQSSMNVFYSVNCFAVVILALCDGAVNQARASLEALQQHPSGFLLQRLGARSTAGLIRVVYEVLEVECPEVLSALEQAGIHPTPAISLWLRQSFVGILSFADSILINAVVLAMGLDYLVYYIIAMFRHLQGVIFEWDSLIALEAVGKNRGMEGAVFSQQSFKLFRAAHVFDYVCSLCHRHRQRCLRGIVEALNE